ncbi:hypothetical protein U1Q18_019571 [Sarracenia purpurea var. burkii]
MNNFLKSLVPLPLLLLLLLLVALHFPSAHAATFTIQNRCLYTVWAAAIPGGGRRLDRGQIWILDIPNGTSGGRIWGRTGCEFDGSGRGNCRTGDCKGLLECNDYGEAPVTIAEFSLTQINNYDFYDLSLVLGFNVPMEFGPVSSGCTRAIKCSADINDECPSKLRAAGGCYHPCTVFGTDEYCCNGGVRDCKLTNYSKFFKDRCPDAYGYAFDSDSLTMFSCPSGTNYEVVFCPENSSLDRTTPFLLVCN